MLRSITSAVTSAMLAVLLIGTAVDHSSSLKIYDNLRQCYRGNNTKHWTANSLQNLLELVRKVEEAYPTSIDMRILAVEILHKLRIDGIERAPEVRETENTIPYGIGGSMVSKFQLILNSVSDTASPINFTDVLTPYELCTFHSLVSSTVEPAVRGDESKTCSLNLSNCISGQDRPLITNKVTTFPNGKVQIIPGDVSTCPEELGVIRTLNYGSFTPGEVITAIAAGLQPQGVQIRELLLEMNKTLHDPVNSEKFEHMVETIGQFDNKNVVGLAGDLAEVCVYQAPYYGVNVSVGLKGYWDDMLFPKARYLADGHYKLWQLTDSEILAGIDAYHLSMSIKGWADRIPTLRLSQVLEMYYSARGIPTAAIENRPKIVDSFSFDGTDSVNFAADNPSGQRNFDKNTFFNGYKDTRAFDDTLDSACERKRILERMSIRTLKEQTFTLAQILQLYVPLYGVSDDLLFDACNTAVDRFMVYAKSLLNGLPDCRNIPSNYRRASVDLTMVLDGSRNETESQKLIGAVAELIDVSTFGSYLTVVHGGTSEVFISRTNSVLKGFEELRYYTEKYPTSFSLSTSLSKVVQLFSNYDAEAAANGTICERSRVVLVFSQGQKITDDDFKNADWLFSGSLQQFTDVYYIFVTNDHKAFDDLIKNMAKTSYVPTDKYTIIDATDLEPKTFLTEVGKIVRQIPKRLIVPSCYSETEDSSGAMTPPKLPSQFEDYVSPNQANYYQINAKDLFHLPELRIRFEGVGYGTFTVCMIRASKQCQSTTNAELVDFVLNQPCPGEDIKECTGVTFVVELDTSKMKCAESDCRYPDQVRYLISLYSSECGGLGAASQKFNCAVFYLLLALMLFLLNVL